VMLVFSSDEAIALCGMGDNAIVPENFLRN
jgi:hypothetical protein